jgi:hypothetical protein
MMTWYEAETLEEWRERRRTQLHRLLRNPFRSKNRVETAAPAKPPSPPIGIASDA